jgi:flavin reductase (DIM6/NTAB) family NADH-FMN oxidoreductase RutF
MQFDIAKLRPSETGRLLTAIVVPRPIAWTITQSADGTLNAAPFSFFNVLSDDPPLVGLGLGRYGSRVHDSTLNIHQTGEFVVNLVAEKQIEAMNITAAEFEPHVDELKIAAVDLQRSVKVKPPRIADSPVSLECELMVKLDVGPKSSIILGRVVFIHIQDEAITEPAGPRVDTHKMRLISRMGGGGLYGRTEGTFNLPRFTLEDWNKQQARKA